MTEVHVPGADGLETTDEELYEAIVQFAEESQGAKVSDDRIQGIRYREPDPKYEKDMYEIEVGEHHPINNEMIEAILLDELRDCYLVCTPNRGVARGMPILVGDEKIIDIKQFG